MIKLLLIAFIILLVLLAIFLLAHLNKPLLAFQKANSLKMKRLIKVTAEALILTSIIGLIILITAPLNYSVITLILGSLITSCFAILISRFS
ncbi:hypothetical protein EQ500_10500 [Lactobacillus sp. XV13L]|nr:hypothetical protein [Lactobacillus sp. XV13L]